MAVIRSSVVDSAPSHGWRWALAGALIGALLALVFFAPARWLASALAAATEGRLLLVNPRGTVWNGASGVVFASGQGGAQSVSLPGSLQWRLRPTWGGLAGALELPCCTAKPLDFDAWPRVGGVRIDWHDGQSRWPAALLAGFGAPWNTLKLEGVLDLKTQALVLDFSRRGVAVAGNATLDATDISSSLSTLRPMGSYRLALQGGATPSLLVSTRAGSLDLAGSGTWSGTALRFNGEASAAPGREDALSNLLNIIGRRDTNRSIITLG